MTINEKFDIKQTIFKAFIPYSLKVASKMYLNLLQEMKQTNIAAHVGTNTGERNCIKAHSDESYLDSLFAVHNFYLMF